MRIASVEAVAKLLLPGRAQLDATRGGRARDALTTADAALCLKGVPPIPCAAFRWRMLGDPLALAPLRERLRSVAREANDFGRLDDPEQLEDLITFVLQHEQHDIALAVVRRACAFSENDWRRGAQQCYAAMQMHLNDEFEFAFSMVSRRLRDPDAA